MFIAKDPTRTNRWVIFSQNADGVFVRMYSTNVGSVAGAKRIQWPATFISECLTDMIRVAA